MGGIRYTHWAEICLTEAAEPESGDMAPQTYQSMVDTCGMAGLRAPQFER